MEFACSVCNYTSIIKTNVTRHIKKTIPCGEGDRKVVETGKKVLNELICKFCNKVFKKKQGLEYHVDNNVCNKQTNSHNITKELEELKKKTEELERQLTEVKITQDKITQDKITQDKPVKNKRKTIPAAVRTKLWIDHNGRSIDGICKVCGSEVNITNFNASHVISVNDGGNNNISNLIPTCSLCNSSMRTQHLEEFKEEYF